MMIKTRTDEIILKVAIEDRQDIYRSNNFNIELQGNEIPLKRADIYSQFTYTTELNIFATHTILKVINTAFLETKKNAPLIFNIESLLNPLFITTY